MFEPFLIVVFESINCPQCEKMDLKIIQSLLERVQICKNAGKLQNLQNVEDLSEEQCSVQLFRTNKGLMNNQHKTKEQSWIGMHDIYRTDKLSTDMGENDVIFIAPINK